MQPQAEAWKARSQHLSDAECSTALRDATHQEIYATLTGIRKFLEHPVPEPFSTPRTAIWQQGSTMLYRYPASSPTYAPIFLVPSLINRPNILDIADKHSLIQFLTQSGHECYLLDWGHPTEGERDFTIEDYITKRLLPTLAETVACTGPVTLAGYCMGGLLAAAAAQLQPESVCGLALLATPWDFHAVPWRTRLPEFHTHLTPLLSGPDPIPGETLFLLLYMLSPWQNHQKFTRFSTMDTESDEADFFLRRECWLQDMVSMSAPAAQEVFLDWGINNAPRLGKWQVSDTIVQPESLPEDIPIFCAMAEYDRIVPPGTTSPWHSLPHTTLHRAQAGHISMVAGPDARCQLWHPLHKWAKTNDIVS